MKTTLLYSLLGFFAGALPFSVWAGRLVLHREIRDYGDHNPGTTNVWKAGGPLLALPVAVLEVGKAAVPVGLAQLSFGTIGWRMVPVALAPLLGHAYSPLLHFRGGKGVACTFGVWIVLTGPLGGLALALLFALFVVVQSVNAWTVVFAMSGWLALLLVLTVAFPLLVIAAAILALVTVRHRADLAERPRVRRRRSRRQQCGGED
jgi:glycerol-3-phosphate acyltransferase PlsY